MKFGSNKQQEDAASNASKVTVLSLGFELTGDIISKSDIRADGILVGSIRTDKKVVVGEQASITGDIIAEEISISGEVVGDLYISGETTIYASAKVSGNITTNQIYVHKGAVLNSLIKTLDAESIKSASKSSKINSVSRDEIYSMLDERKTKAASEEKPEKIGQPNREASTYSSNEPDKDSDDMGKNFPRTW
ncbi:bactofilin family protein [Pleomorphovibrio marinus]|uniref:bactofilin family protein n=1 Tax=Pleomorphovibrio marinus TaxID=2164132 RepID=UPI000E0AC1C2|nr:polymer-forming cytoskeletal protein [Pleomorphovibrio marinus]